MTKYSRYEDLKASYQVLKQCYDSLQIKFDESKDDLHEIHKSHDALIVRRHNLVFNYEELKKDYRTLVSAHAKLCNESEVRIHCDQDDDAKKAEDAHDLIKVNYGNLKKEHEELKKDYQDLEKDHDKLCHECEVRIHCDQDDAAKKAHELGKIKYAHDLIKVNYEDLKKEHEELKNERNILICCSNDKRAELDEIHSLYNSLTVSHDNLKKEHAELEKVYARLKNECDNIRIHSQKKIDEFKNAHRNLENDRYMWNERYKDLDILYIELRTEKNILVEECEFEKTRRELLKDEYKKIVDDCENRIQCWIEEVDELKSHKENYIKGVKKSRHFKYDTLRFKYDKLKLINETLHHNLCTADQCIRGCKSAHDALFLSKEQVLAALVYMESVNKSLIETNNRLYKEESNNEA